MPHVAGVNPAIRRDHLGQFHNLVGLSEHPRQINQAGGQPGRPLLHRRLQQLFHPLHFLRRWRPVEVAAHGPGTHTIVADQAGDIDCHIRRLDLAEKPFEIQRRAPAVARHHRRDSHPHKILRPRHLRQLVRVRMHVNETRRHHQAPRLDFLLRLPVHLAHPHDAPRANSNVGKPGRIARPIHPPPVPNHQVVRFSPRR